MMSFLPTSRSFGKLPGGEPIEAWEMHGEGGLTLEAITFGAVITRVILPDGVDVVLGFDNLESYVAEHPYFGAMVGRVAGRLTGAAFELEGRKYKLAKNANANTLHGGLVGFDKRVWQATPRVRSDGSPSLRLELTSADGDQGFPGDLNITVDYTVTRDNTLLIETAASTNKATPLSLTNHSYFNLAGHDHGDSLLDHDLQVSSETLVATDEHFTLLDRLDPVGGAADLRQDRRLREAVCEFYEEHGYMYRTGADGAIQCVARLTAPQSKWVMECSTDAPYLQVYTGSHIEGPIGGKGGATYGKFAGLCVECQNYPNAANAPHMDDRGILFPGVIQRTTIAYKFSAEKQRGAHGSDC
jgi:aldose 1-epimerase